MTTLAELAAQKRDHSIFAPSSAAVWARCAGSLVAAALADDSPSFYAAEGSVAHDMAARWLQTGKRPTHMVGQVVMYDGFAVTVDDNMLAYVEQYVEWVGFDGCVETKVDFSEYMPIPGQTGTADHYEVEPGALTITDLKYGQGVKVFAEDNYQLLLYALGVFLLWDWYYDFQTITVRICQPRLDHFDVHTISRTDLLVFADWIRGRGIAAWDVSAHRTPGEKQCEGCNRKVRAACPAYLLWFQALRDNEASDVFDEPAPAVQVTVPAMIAAAERAGDVFEADEPIVLPELSIEAWARIFPMRKAIEKWFADGEARLFAAALNGEAPGYKIVTGRSNRKWADPDTAKERMLEVGVPADETENRSLKSPNQVEEYLHGAMKLPKTKAKALFDSHTMREEGVRTLVRTSDKREAVPDYGSVFDGD